MTAWKLLCDTICPTLLVTFLNNINAVDGEVFTAEYLIDLEEHCPCDGTTGDALCNKCWLDFMRSEVK